MKKVAFNLDYFKQHHPMVETFDGHKVRIICTDCKMYKKPVVGLVDTSSDDFEYEVPYCYTENGFYLENERCEIDLFMLINE